MTEQVLVRLQHPHLPPHRHLVQRPLRHQPRLALHLHLLSFKQELPHLQLAFLALYLDLTHPPQALAFLNGLAHLPCWPLLELRGKAGQDWGLEDTWGKDRLFFLLHLVGLTGLYYFVFLRLFLPLLRLVPSVFVFSGDHLPNIDFV